MISLRFIGLDISNKCGFVALDQYGKVLRDKELTGIGDEEPRRMVTLAREIAFHIQPGDIICIEDFALSFGQNNKSQRQDQIHGLGWLVRAFLFMEGHKFRLIKPSQRQAFVGVTGWVEDPENPGKKKKVSGKPLKQLVMDEVARQYDFHSPSDNINDAFILAKIGEALHEVETKQHFMPFPDYQYNVLKKIMAPAEKKTRAKKKK